jgi:hypothetical protein
MAAPLGKAMIAELRMELALVAGVSPAVRTLPLRGRITSGWAIILPEL